MTSKKRSRATLTALRGEGRSAASPTALSRHAKAAAKKSRKPRRSGGKRKSASTKAGKYVHDEIKHVREGKHGARSAKQVIAIGLSKARKSGVKVPPKRKAA